ncbi:MAG TPA: hypothetical protein VK302_06420 [Terriglobales bacterium]|nr:hypothetical protein [Terriglobales bacterium]
MYTAKKSLVVSRQSFATNCLLTTDDRRPTTEKSYNIRVNAPVPPKPVADHERHHHHHAIYAAEATGLLLMAVLLLILTIIRYWRYIPWSAR